MARGSYPTAEHKECIERIALDIFVDMTNAGFPLQETLAAILNTGMSFAIELPQGQQG